jgi:mono/diheme cytochrome c family protein
VKTTKTIVAAMLLLLLAGAAPKSDPPANDSQVHSIQLPHFTPYLPPGDGRELFATACLACHSTRYMSMQPPLTAAKWEENVKKMIKTYGAPLSEDQAPALAKYLVAFQQAPPDPLSGVTANPEPPPVDLSTPGDAHRGFPVYRMACASCHGLEGKGDGPAMPNLLPVATDLTAGRFAPSAILSSIRHGVPGSAMPAFPSLSAEQIRNVVAYTASLGTAGENAPTDAGDAKTLFASSCASCHGPSGAGDGFNAPTLPRVPTNFHIRQPSFERALHVISEGGPGTPMPSWKAKLTDAQRKQLAAYVRTFYDADQK